MADARILRGMTRLLVLVLALGCAETGTPAPTATEAESRQPTRESVEARGVDEAPSLEVETPLEVDSPESALVPAESEAPRLEVPPTGSAPVAPEVDPPVERPSEASNAPRYRVVSAAVDEAENGRGELVAVIDAVALEFDAADFPAGGTDPVLRVGNLRFTRYRYPRIGVLRFELADRAVLAGNPVFIERGSVRTRVSR